MACHVVSSWVLSFRRSSCRRNRGPPQDALFAFQSFRQVLYFRPCEELSQALPLAPAAKNLHHSPDSELKGPPQSLSRPRSGYKGSRRSRSLPRCANAHRATTVLITYRRDANRNAKPEPFLTIRIPPRLEPKRRRRFAQQHECLKRTLIFSASFQCRYYGFQRPFSHEAVWSNPKTSKTSKSRHRTHEATWSIQGASKQSKNEHSKQPHACEAVRSIRGQKGRAANRITDTHRRPFGASQ